MEVLTGGRPTSSKRKQTAPERERETTSEKDPWKSSRVDGRHLRSRNRQHQREYERRRPRKTRGSPHGWTADIFEAGTDSTRESTRDDVRERRPRKTRGSPHGWTADIFEAGTDSTRESTRDDVRERPVEVLTGGRPTSSKQEQTAPERVRETTSEKDPWKSSRVDGRHLRSRNRQHQREYERRRPRKTRGSPHGWTADIFEARQHQREYERRRPRKTRGSPHGWTADISKQEQTAPERVRETTSEKDPWKSSRVDGRHLRSRNRQHRESTDDVRERERTRDDVRERPVEVLTGGRPTSSKQEQTAPERVRETTSEKDPWKRVRDTDTD